MWICLAALLCACQQRPAAADGIAAAPAAAPTAASAAPTPAAAAASATLPEPAVAPVATSAGGAQLSATETARLDAVMAPERVFSSPAQRAAYRARPAEARDGKRSYGFELSSQPGMIEGQHFHSVTFTFAPAGTLLQHPSSEPEIISGGGPRESFVRASARSGDGAYDVSVMERMLLPSSMPRPELRAETALAAVLERLGTQ